MNERRPHIIVIGGGPAGLMAAGFAAEAGAKVTLFEKMNKTGKKLNITGKGRCNLTNSAPLKEFITKYGENKKGRFLYQAFSQFFTPHLIDFLKEKGVEVKEERGGRIFPVSDNASDITHALTNWIRKNKVEIFCSDKVKKILINKDRVCGIELDDGEQFTCDAIVIATGGSSYPLTGSTGDGFKMAKKLGHTIVPIRPALVPLVTKSSIPSRIAGLALKNVEVSFWIDGKKTYTEFGEMLFTHFGVSGPVILKVSGDIIEHVDNEEKVEMKIDLKPALDHKKLDNRLLRDFDKSGTKLLKNLMPGLLPKSLIDVCLEMTGLDPDIPCNQISSEMRKRLRVWLKEFTLEIDDTRPIAEALVTAGGVSLKEIDPNTMMSNKVYKLFFAGEVIDIDADTGGYNLMAAFSTGRLAGISAYRICIS